MKREGGIYFIFMKREGGRGREKEGEKREEGEGKERKRGEQRRGGKGREKEGQKREEGEGEGRKRRDEEEEKRERGGGGEKVFYFSLFNVTSSAARNCSPLYPPLSSPFPSLTPLRHPGRPQLPPPLRVGGQDGSRT